LGLRATDGNTGDTARSAEDSHTSETGSMFANLRIAVVGAGPVGLLTAIALARRGYRQIKVYDRLSEPQHQRLKRGVILKGPTILGLVAVASEL